MSGKPKITQPTQRAAPKPATRMQAPADDSNSENNSEDTPPAEDIKTEMEELRNMMRETINMVQASNLNMDERFKLFDSRVVELIENKIETSSREMNRKVEGRLEVDLKVIGESMHSVVKRLETTDEN